MIEALGAVIAFEDGEIYEYDSSYPYQQDEVNGSCVYGDHHELIGKYEHHDENESDKYNIEPSSQYKESFNSVKNAIEETNNIPINGKLLNVCLANIYPSLRKARTKYFDDIFIRKKARITCGSFAGGYFNWESHPINHREFFPPISGNTQSAHMLECGLQRYEIDIEIHDYDISRMADLPTFNVYTCAINQNRINCQAQFLEKLQLSPTYTLNITETDGSNKPISLLEINEFAADFYNKKGVPIDIIFMNTNVCSRLNSYMRNSLSLPNAKSSRMISCPMVHNRHIPDNMVYAICRINAFRFYEGPTILKYYRKGGQYRVQIVDLYAPYALKSTERLTKEPGFLIAIK